MLKKPKLQYKFANLGQTINFITFQRHATRIFTSLLISDLQNFTLTLKIGYKKQK